jgi:hypothetical protein
MDVYLYSSIQFHLTYHNHGACLKGFYSTRVDGSHVAATAGLIIVGYDAATHSLYPEYGQTYFKTSV